MFAKDSNEFYSWTYKLILFNSPESVICPEINCYSISIQHVKGAITHIPCQHNRNTQILKSRGDSKNGISFRLFHPLLYQHLEQTHTPCFGIVKHEIRTIFAGEPILVILNFPYLNDNFPPLDKGFSHLFSCSNIHSGKSWA